MNYRIAAAAEVMNVSTDTVRRWLEAGDITRVDGPGPVSVDGASLAAFAASRADEANGGASPSSARNRLVGIVTRVRKDGVMAQVEMICGRSRVVSLMSAEAADELGLEPGVRTVASIKATNVVVERP